MRVFSPRRRTAACPYLLPRQTDPARPRIPNAGNALLVDPRDALLLLATLPTGLCLARASTVLAAMAAQQDVAPPPQTVAVAPPTGHTSGRAPERMNQNVIVMPRVTVRILMGP
jgi:hypothetical protein